MKLNQKLKKKSIVIATHVYATGPTHALEELLKDKVKELLFIGHPFVFAKEKRSHLRFYNASEKKRHVSYSPLVFSNQFLSLIKDMILTIIWSIQNDKTDIFIGADCFNACAGILLKKLGFTKKVVFYTIDYIPKRFSNKFLNTIYHSLDTFAVKQSDMVWNLSDVMIKEREKKGVSKYFRKKQLLVPMGTETNIKEVPFEKIKKTTAVHMGHLIPKQGLQLVIEAMPDIIKKVPEFRLEIIGAGSYEGELKKMSKRYAVEKYITWRGFVKDHSTVEMMLSECAFGLAPYVNFKDNYIQYTDPGKVKAYLTASLPMIITKIAEISKEIQTRECGIAIDYTKKDIVTACVRLSTDRKLLRKMKKNVAIMAKDYSWEIIFSRALSPLI